MLQSTSRLLHVAIVMDGNGRWALERGLPRTEGHRAGARALHRIVEAAAGHDIRTLTLYAFSSDNWQRPETEVRGLMDLFQEYLLAEIARCVNRGIRLTVIGRRDRLALPLLAAIRAAERATAGGAALRLRIAIDYSARDAMLRAAARRPRRAETRESFARALADALHDPLPVEDVDLLIRTGGEQRLSDFLLWESAYAELYFTARLWPDFAPADLDHAIATFRSRERRFGAIPLPAPGRLVAGDR